MAADLFQAIEQIGREKGIDVNVIIEAVEDAYVAASRKVFRSKEELASRFNKEDGSISVFAVKRVVEEVENEDLEISLADGKKLDPKLLSRLFHSYERRSPRGAVRGLPKP